MSKSVRDSFHRSENSDAYRLITLESLLVSPRFNFNGTMEDTESIWGTREENRPTRVFSSGNGLFVRIGGGKSEE